ncbi:MAG: bifunctional 4-hydroxy-3-methylbut-2-enyl diphosphate reductase/30S ribosomal protein S1 [Oscillospiraceae bacterium]|nr:bifunctional 4-hydroxy-3-methylbut-2-enyl diphosphate reductase/30S ribosomal protein S1 [Oscillospiraceae bacterium]
MKVILAKSAGFCYGVKRAVELALQTAAGETPSAMLGPVIHNTHVVEELERQGMVCLTGPEQVQPGTKVVIRSHGEAKATYDKVREAGAEILDATCPNVARIHRLVAEAGQAGRIPVIVGTRTHPEVVAIAGWSPRSVIVETAEELENWIKEEPNRKELPITMVSQTTSTRTSWESCREIAKKLCTNAEIFDTICNATHERQTEAQKLAATCDAMIVIGDKKSSNTRHLAELCRESCPLVLWIESAAELDAASLQQAQSIGITAGASTPGWIIKEVQNNMSEENIEIEKSFAEMLEESIKTLNTGDKVTGTVVGITPTEIQVELGTKHAGIIPTTELSDDPSAKVEDLVKIGDQIETYVMRVNDQEGIVTLSKKRLDSVKNWEDIESARENKTVVEAKITETNKGGVVTNLRGIRVFIPASQTGLPKNGDMESLVHTTVRLRITEVNRARRRVVGSIRAVQAEERAAKAAAVWAEIEPGKKYTGVVKSLTSYGAFVDIGGVDGMVHISALSWSRIKHPSEVVSVGDTVNVYVISADPEKKKISLGMKDPDENPWEVFINKYQVGDVANVRIVKLMTFGAFAEIVPGVDGLIHISQIADHRIEKPGDELAEGDRVDVKITDIDMEKKKVSLSIRALLQD